MYKIPTDYNGRDEALDAILLLVLMAQEVEESMAMALNLVTAETITTVKTHLAIKQAKLGKINNAIGVITALHQFNQVELDRIDAEVYGFDPSLG